MFETHRIVSVLRGEVPVGSEAVVEGWVRTRRDSKAGLSFVNVHDGSCFEPLQVVCGRELEGYESVVLHLTSGAAVRVRGAVVPSQGKGQSVELRATRVELVGGVDDPAPAHHFGLGKGMLYIELLANLKKLPPRGAYFIYLPLNISGGSAGPGRGIGLVPRDQG